MPEQPPAAGEADNNKDPTADMTRMQRQRYEVMAVLRGSTHTHALLRDRVVVLVDVTLLLDAVFSVVIWLVERGVDGSQVRGYGDALFWTTSQLLTVSSSLTTPLTATGKALDVLMEVWAITVVASLAGSLGSFFHRRGLERHPMDAR